MRDYDYEEYLQIQEINKQEREREKWRNKKLEEVKTISEIFDENFNKMSKMTKFNNSTLYKCLNNFDLQLKDITCYKVLKDNLNSNNVLDDILEAIKEKDIKTYKTLLKYKECIKVEKKYKSIFELECYAYLIAREMIYNATVTRNISFHTNLVDHIINIEERQKVIFPKNNNLKLLVENLNLEDVDVLANIKCESRQLFYKIYSEIKKVINADVKQKFKQALQGKNCFLSYINFNKLGLECYLVPCYKIHCIKPGFDIKYIICATNKKLIKF